MKRSILLLPGAVFLSACVLGPEPANPDLAAPISIRSDTAPHGASFGDKSWRKVFTDSDLRDLIELAIKNNPDLTAATYRIEEARAIAGATRAAWFPSLDGSGGATSNYTSPNAGQVAPSGDRSSDSYNLTSFLSWELDLWGGIRRSNQAARARFLQATYQRDAVQTSLVASMASAYIDLKNLDERLAIARRTVESRKASLELVTARRDGGVSSDLEVGQAETLLGQAQVLIPITENAIAAKENEIRALLGEYPGGITRSGSLDQVSTSLTIAGGLPSALMERRPDLAAANQSFQAATADIGTAEALRLPGLSLTGSGGLVSGDLSDLLQGKSTAFSIGPRLTGPLFDAGRRSFGVKAAQARAKQALAAYDRAAKQAFREASNALKAHEKTGEIVAQRKRLVAATGGVSRVAQDRFQGGASSYLEVLDAERSLFTAELDLADAKRDRLLAVVQAYRALGGGWR